jgi:hypothetical protein
MMAECAYAVGASDRMFDSCTVCLAVCSQQSSMSPAGFVSVCLSSAGDLSASTCIWLVQACFRVSVCLAGGNAARIKLYFMYTLIHRLWQWTPRAVAHC